MQPSMAEVLEDLARACAPSREDYERRVALIDECKKAVRRMRLVTKADVVPYGSFVSTFYNGGSDLGWVAKGRLKPAALAEIFRGRPEEDWVPLHKLDKTTKKQVLREAVGCLMDARVTRYRETQPKLGARVPIITFTHSATRIEVDLCVGSSSTPLKAWTISQVASIHPAFSSLYRVVKVWAKAHGINDGASQTFNSWCLTLLVIFFLQTYPKPALLPPLHQLLYAEVPARTVARILEGEQEMPEGVYDIIQQRVAVAREEYGKRPAPPLDVLLRQFVDVSGAMLRALMDDRQGGLREARVSVFYGELIRGWPFAKQYMLCVEDPYDATDNCARTLCTWDQCHDTFYYIADCFTRTAARLNALAPPNTSSPAAASSSASSSASAAAAAAAAAGLATASAAPSASSAAPQLGPTLLFMFGPELLQRLPAHARRLLGPQAEAQWQALVAEGVAGCTAHARLLRTLGMHKEYVTFEEYKRRHDLRRLRDAERSAEELAAEARRQEERARAKRAKEQERRQRKEQQRREQQQPAAGTASTSSDVAADAAVATAAATAAVTGKGRGRNAREPQSQSAAGAAAAAAPAAAAPEGGADAAHQAAEAALAAPARQRQPSNRAGARRANGPVPDGAAAAVSASEAATAAGSGLTQGQEGHGPAAAAAAAAVDRPAQSRGGRQPTAKQRGKAPAAGSADNGSAPEAGAAAAEAEAGPSAARRAPLYAGARSKPRAAGAGEQGSADGSGSGGGNGGGGGSSGQGGEPPGAALVARALAALKGPTHGAEEQGRKKTQQRRGQQPAAQGGGVAPGVPE